MNPNSDSVLSRDYERLVESLVRQGMEGISGVEGLEILQDVKMRGASGHEHQIDVCYRFRIWSTEFLVLVECKHYRKRVGIEDLLTFRSRMEDLRAHKGVFVTAEGYQKGALEYAKSHRMALLIVRGNDICNVSFSSSLAAAPRRVATKEEVRREQIQRSIQQRSARDAEARQLTAVLTDESPEALDHFEVGVDGSFFRVVGANASVDLTLNELLASETFSEFVAFPGTGGEVILQGHALGLLKPSG